MLSLYLLLIKLHPKTFRDRFGDELLLAFDDMRATHGAFHLIADQVVSLVRHWTRPQTVRTSLAVNGPVFHVFQPRPLPPGAILVGTASALLLLAAIQFATNHWSSFQFPIGTWRGTAQPTAHGISANPSGFGSLVIGSGPMANAWTAEAQRYIASMPVLSMLDRNGDGLLSIEEVQRAPDSLRILDTGRDGQLTAAECGAAIRNAAAFMRLHPVHRVLDKNHDTTIDAAEIEAAASSLRTLDLNHDGALYPPELLPEGSVLSLLRRLP